MNMIKLLLTTIMIFTAISDKSYALMGWTNCENEDQTIIRTEREIWGSNKVEWQIEGSSYQSLQEEFYFDSKIIHSRSSVHDEFLGKGDQEIYTIQVGLYSIDSELVEIDEEVTCESTVFRTYD